MVAHVVSSAEGAQAFARRQPALPAEWLCVFDPGVRYGQPTAFDAHTGDGPVIDPFDWYCLDSDPRPREQREGLDLSGRIPAQAWSGIDPSPADCEGISQTQVAHVRGYFASDQPELPVRTQQLAHWITRIWRNPAAAWWAGGQQAISELILRRIRDELERTPRKNVRQAVAAAWRAYLDYRAMAPGENRVRLLEQRIQRTGWSHSVAREYVACFAPSLALSGVGRSPVPPAANSRPSSRDLVNVTLKYEKGLHGIQVPDDYLQVVIPGLQAQLELAEDLETRHGFRPDICSIEPDDEGENEGDASVSRSHRLSGPALTFVELFRRLADRSPELARSELQTWPERHDVLSRIRIWALGNLPFATANEFADALLTLERSRFWPFRGERDLLLGLAKRWSGMDLEKRRNVERRLRAGPPKPKGSDREQHAERAAAAVLSRLHWLHAQGCEFTFNLDSLTEKLQSAAPRWRPRHADHAARSRDGRSGRVRTVTDYSSIAALPPEDILDHLEQQGQSAAKPFIRLDPFLGLSEERPELALQALTERSATRPFVASYWEKFLRREPPPNDNSELSVRVLDALLGLSDENFAQIALAASDWFERAASGTLFDGEPRYVELWSKFMRVLRDRAEAGSSAVVQQGLPAGRTPDWLTRAIHSPAGSLAQLVFHALPDNVDNISETLTAPWLTRLEQLLSLPDDGRRYALVSVARHLDWLYAVDPGWTTGHILVVLDDHRGAEADQEALWAGFFSAAQVPSPTLFVKLEPHLVALTKATCYSDRRHSEILAGTLLAGWRTQREGTRLVSHERMRSAILHSDEMFRHFLLWTWRRWSDDGDGCGPAEIVEFLSFAWPKHKSVRTLETSGQLCALAFSRNTGFPEVARMVTKLIAKVPNAQSAIIPELRKLEQVSAGEHPREVVDLLHAFLPDHRARWPYGAQDALRVLRENHPLIRTDPKFVELEGRA